MGDYWPGWTATTILFFVFFIAQYENQRWVRARAGGMRGANEGIGLAVDLSGAAAMVFGIIWLIAYGFDAGWRYAVGLFLVGLSIMVAYSLVSTTIVASVKRATMDRPALQFDRMGGDWLLLWMLGTLAVWPLMVLLGTRVSWFGLL